MSLYKDEDFSVFSTKEQQYLKNKNKGGLNNSKGNYYETAFTTYKIAEHSVRYYEDNINFFIYRQVKTPIDDLIVKEANYQEHFQLKDVKDLQFDNGIHPIITDLILQNKLNSSKNITNKLFIVNSNFENCNNIKEQIKNDTNINEFSDIIFFPNDKNKIDNELQKKLKNISISNEKGPLNALSIIIFGYLGKCNNEFSFEDLITTIQNITPHSVKMKNVQLDENLIKILEKIHEITFEQYFGFLKIYSKENLTLTFNTIIPYYCNSDEFIRKFQNEVIKNKPTDIWELWSLITE